jgi:tetratricopeptide (TPR) repeat protein
MVSQGNMFLRLGSFRNGFNSSWGKRIFLLAAMGAAASIICAVGQTGSHAIDLAIIVVNTRPEAERILEELKKGEDFASLAKAESTDATAADAGEMGTVDPSTLRSELREAVQGLRAGQISGIVKIPAGFAILKILSASPAPGGEAQTPNRPSPLPATGTIRYAPSIGGQGEADLAFRAFNKPAGWEQNLAEMCSIRKQSLAAMTAQLKEGLSSATPSGLTGNTPMDVIQAHYALADLYAYQGEMEPAIEQWLEAYQVAQTQLPEAMGELEEALGIAYLHESEIENDVYRVPGDRCIFPPKAGVNVKYAKTADSERAIEYFTRYLVRKPDQLDIKWLLNLAYMTMGQYPDGVPSLYRLPVSAFQSPEDVVHFKDVAAAVGINSFGMSGGLIVDDFENNGRFDVVTSAYGECEPMHYFHNNGDGTFSDRTKEAGLSDELGGLNMIQGDYNNDGCLDILVLRGAWKWPERNSLLRNNCNGTFTDVTEQAGLAQPATSTQTAVWVDIDNDGLLDLFVGNEKSPAQLFHNKGDGTFEDIAHSAGVDGVAFTKAVAAGDYDNDGYMDLYVSNMNGNNVLYHNNHNRTFTDVAEQAGVQKPWQSFPAWFFDYDNDGWPDLFVTSYYISVDETLRSYLGMPGNVETLKLYKNMRDGTFRDVTEQVGLNRVFMPMGSNFGDVDNDGYLDIYLGTGNPSYASLLPNVLLHNQEGKHFTDITASSGTGDLHKGHGVAFADMDNDGQEDLLEEMGGAVPGDAHAFRFYENSGNQNDWISLHLVGVKTNRAAIGARIKVTLQDAGQAARSIYRTVGSGGSFGASPLTQHIGLGKSAKILNLEIWWPASNTRQEFANLAPDQFLEIREFSKNLTKLERHRYRLGEEQPKTATLSQEEDSGPSRAESKAKR